jgi:hypothetical protein
MRVQKMMIEKELLLREIGVVFANTPMPASDKLTIHQHACESCDDVSKYFEAYRYQKIEDELLFRFLRRNLNSLSPVAYRWVLPLYLKFCLNSKWWIAQDSVYFLIFNLCPDPDFERDTYFLLSALTVEQINCLINFLRWCSETEDSVDIEEDIDKAVNFLQKAVSRAPKSF